MSTEKKPQSIYYVSEEERHPVVSKMGMAHSLGDATRVYENPGRFHSSMNGWRNSLEYNELVVAADELREAIGLTDEQEVFERARLAADLKDVLYLMSRCTLGVKAWCVVGTYDPQGTFNPGGQVTWSAHFTKEEAERCLPLWEKYLNRPKDPMHVEFKECDVQHLKTEMWEGPRR